MARKESVHRYLIGVEEDTNGWSRYELKPHHKTTGTYFEVYRSSEDNLWHWKLFLASSRHGATARSARGYATRQTAEGTILTAFKAIQDAARK